MNRASVAPWETTMMSEPSQVRMGTGRVIGEEETPRPSCPTAF